MYIVSSSRTPDEISIQKEVEEVMLQDCKNMISPFTGGKVSLHWRWEDMEFRKDKIRVVVPYYICEDTKEQFTTTESDGVWMNQLHNHYCSKYGIPFTDEIIALRERYGISALKMSLILGFGENQWRRYEQEEIPSLSNGKMIRSIMNPKVFLDLVECSKSVLTEKEYEKITSKVMNVIATSEDFRIMNYERKRIFACERSEENGFAPLSLSRLKNIILYILGECGETFCTKMNKMLFYVDFLSYRETGMAMTGLTYRAIDYGPVPERWDRVYSQYDDIHQEPRVVGKFEGNVLTTTQSADLTIFTQGEIAILDVVCNKFKDVSSSDISAISHDERAWKEYHTNRMRIPYEKAFTLKAV